MRQIAPSYIGTDCGAKSESHAKCVSIAVDMVSARMIADDKDDESSKSLGRSED